MFTKYQAYLDRARARYGTQLDTFDLNPAYIPALESGERITVEFLTGGGEVYETRHGTVGVTGGWRPTFILMLTKRSRGSSHLLNFNSRIKE